MLSSRVASDQGGASGRGLSGSPQVNATAGQQSPLHLPGKPDLRTDVGGCWREPWLPAPIAISISFHHSEFRD